MVEKFLSPWREAGTKPGAQTMIKGRVIAIGDVHGCSDELGGLLGILSPGADDLVVFLGDLVNRGPDSHACLELARSVRSRSLLGNHELRLLEFHRTGNEKPLRDDDRRTSAQLTDEDWSHLNQMVLFHELPDLDLVFVHGGFLPGQAWQKQPASVVTHIQVIDPKGRPQRRADCANGTFWADVWPGPPFVVYGHTPRPEVYEKSSSLGIDTGCVMGGHLTAYILPERKIVQVKARKKYV